MADWTIETEPDESAVRLVPPISDIREAWPLDRSPNNELCLASSYELPHGLGRLEIGGKILVRRADGGLRLSVSAGATLTLKVKPLIPIDASVLANGIAGEGDWVVWPLESAHDNALVIEAKFSSDPLVPLGSENGLLQCLALAVTADTENSHWNFDGIKCSTFDFPLRRQFDNITGTLGDLKLSGGSPSIDGETLSVSDTILEFESAGSLVLTLSKLQVNLRTMRVDLDSLEATLDRDAYIFADPTAPFTLALYKGNRFTLNPRLVSPSINIAAPQGTSRTPGTPALTAVVPGCTEDELKRVMRGEQLDRLIFDLSPLQGDQIEVDGAIRIGPRGLRGEANLRAITFALNGLEDCRLSEGQLTFCDALFDARVTATARLPYFCNSVGSLVMRTSSEKEFSATWEMAVEKTWTDPTGNFALHEPKPAVFVGYGNGKWKVRGTLGGQLQFIAASRIEGAAKQWLSALAGNLRLSFAELDLEKLGKFAKGEASGQAPIKLELKLLQKPGPLELWKVLTLNLEEFALLSSGFSFGGRISSRSAGGLSFEGRLPRLSCTMSDGAIQLSTQAGDELGFMGKLTTPGGVSAALDLRRERSARTDELIGAGSLSIPSMPAIAITCVLGQRKVGRASEPVFLLFARSDYPVPLYPGFVMRNIGIGLGINKVLKVVADTPHKQLVSQIVNGPTGWPDPALPASWTTPPGGRLDLSLIADTYIAPSQTGNGPFPYVGAATLYARPTNDFLILLGANLWLMTSLSDASTPEFREAPVAIGALALFPRHGYLELQVRTKQNARMTEPVPLIEQGLKIASGELYLRASRDDFLFRVGPLRSAISVGKVKLAGQIVFATYLGNKGVLAVVQGSLNGETRHEDKVAMRFGPLSVTAGFRFEAKLAFETVLAGMVVPRLGMALYQRARIYVALTLAAWVEIAFRLVIKFWRFRKTISWSASHSVSLSLSVDLWLEVLVAKPDSSALYGRASVNIRLFGYEFSPSLTVGAQSDSLAIARQSLGNVLSTKGL